MPHGRLCILSQKYNAGPCRRFFVHMKSRQQFGFAAAVSNTFDSSARNWRVDDIASSTSTAPDRRPIQWRFRFCVGKQKTLRGPLYDPDVWSGRALQESLSNWR
jgi:hypothetical protein